MDETEFENIIQLITKTSGMIPGESHKTGIKNFLEKRIPQIEEPFQNYYSYLCSHPQEVSLLINSATVNETYFFREEIQFQLLKEKILPELAAKKGNHLKIWSAASSSGEEIYSLYLLLSSMKINAEYTATDINTNVLEICEKGEYKENTLRTVDGAAFKDLLMPYKNPQGGFTFPKEICNKITRKQLNLFKMEDVPQNQDIVFIRNVFIYFNSETKKNILEKITQEALAPGGYLFVSMNETASIEKNMIPQNLEKCSDGKIFYFRKMEC